MDKTYQVILRQIQEYEKMKSYMNAFKLSGSWNKVDWDGLIDDLRIKISLLNRILKESEIEYRKENEFTNLFDMINDVLPYTYKIRK